MHANDSAAALMDRALKQLTFPWLPQTSRALNLGFNNKAMQLAQNMGEKKQLQTRNKNKIIAPVITLIFLTQCHMETLAILCREWGMSLGLFCSCVNWISALPVPPWQGSDWINGVESIATWQGDRLLVQLDFSMGTHWPAESPGRPQTS